MKAQFRHYPRSWHTMREAFLLTAAAHPGSGQSPRRGAALRAWICMHDAGDAREMFDTLMGDYPSRAQAARDLKTTAYLLDEIDSLIRHMGAEGAPFALEPEGERVQRERAEAAEAEADVLREALDFLGEGLEGVRDDIEARAHEARREFGR